MPTLLKGKPMPTKTRLNDAHLLFMLDLLAKEAAEREDEARTKAEEQFWLTLRLDLYEFIDGWRSLTDAQGSQAQEEAARPQEEAARPQEEAARPQEGEDQDRG